ncbi:YybH family protein [Planctomyces sp. SH-PL62]|uniref:YybH family protein n=1 Tax=Planctomyces sp. SH-PL62 TaxID=1636152 RepID=UPI0018D28FC8|nr:SgcJ/EcaC family oxidoreductase [Planctomyces sp. SH-PL62]
MSRSTRLLILLAFLGIGFGFANARVFAEEPPASPAGEADRAAIHALLAEFVKAYDAGDAHAIAALFTSAARIEAEDADPIVGRAAIEKRFAERFEAEPGRTIVVEPTSLRMLGADAAIEEGLAVVASPPDGDHHAGSVRFRYTAAYVREDGRWLQDSIHDFPMPDLDAEKSPRERLADLEWLIGEWIDQDDDAEVETTCEWADDGAFLIRKFRVKAAGSIGLSGVQRVGWDPRLKQFRSWTFDSEGGFSEGLWSHEDGDDRWIIKTTGVLKDGRTASATNIVSRRGRDVVRWSSVERTLGSSALPGVEEVTLVRRPPPPRAAASPSTPAPTSTPGDPARSRR